MNENIPTMWVRGWLPNGFQVSFTLPVDTQTAYDTALAFTNGLLARGFRQTEPELEAGEESEVIVTVMRREKPSDGTPIIDFYPAWGAGGDEPFGTYKYVHKYLNDDDEIAAFLAASGFKALADIPLYDGQVSLKRTPGKRHAKETPVPTPFKVVRKQGAEKTGSDGKLYRPWELVRYEPAATAAPPSAPVQAPAQPAATEPELKTATFMVYAVQTREAASEDGKNTIFYQMPTGNEYVYAYSRDVFRAAGIAVNDSWKKPGFAMRFDKPLEVKAELRPGKNGKMYWHVITPELPADLKPAAGNNMPF